MSQTTPQDSPFGLFSSADLPTDHGRFRIHVLPQLIKLGHQNGKPVATFIEHYAMVPVGFMPLGYSLFHVHRTNLFEDLFLPALEGEKQLNIPQQLLNLLNQTGNGVLLYTDELTPKVLKELQSDLDTVIEYQATRTNIIAEHFARHPEISTYPVTSPTRIHESKESSGIKQATVHRLNEVVDVHMPSVALSLLFPGLESGTVLRKHLSHFAVVQEVTRSGEYPYVRVHSSCATGDINGSHKCDCGIQFRQAMS